MVNDLTLTATEEELLSYAKNRVYEIALHRKSKNLYDALLGFVISDSGNIYEGIPLEVSQLQANVCAERNAIANMVLNETENSKVDAVLIAAPIPKPNSGFITPCGSCRHAINEFSDGKASVLCVGYIRHADDWTIFSGLKKYSISFLYPKPYQPTKW